MPATGPAAAHARVMACLTFLSRVLGLIREQLFSYYFGTGGLLSAFRIAFMVPNLARRLFGEGALSAAMIPVLTKSLQDRGDAASRKLVGSLVVQLVLVLLLLVAVVEAGIALGRTRYDNVVLTLTNSSTSWSRSGRRMPPNGVGRRTSVILRAPTLT